MFPNMFQAAKSEIGQNEKQSDYQQCFMQFAFHQVVIIGVEDIFIDRVLLAITDQTYLTSIQYSAVI